MQTTFFQPETTRKRHSIATPIDNALVCPVCRPYLVAKGRQLTLEVKIWGEFSGYGTCPDCRTLYLIHGYKQLAIYFSKITAPSLIRRYRQTP